MDDVVDWPGLVAHAGSPRRARTLVADGHWRRVLQGAYAAAHLEDGPQLRAAALRLVLPVDVALSHRSALWACGLDVLGDGLDVTVPRTRRLEPRPGVRPHTAALPDDQVCWSDGRLVVSAARAVVDVARSERTVEAVVVADVALRAGLTSQEELAEVLRGAAGLRGVRRAREALSLVDPRSESPIESRLRCGFVQGGLRVASQVDLYDDAGHVARVDLVVEDVLVEFDGRQAHLQGDAFVRERRRQSRLLDAGADLRRFTSADVYGRTPRDLCAEVLRAASRPGARGLGDLRRGPDTQRAPRAVRLPTLADLRHAGQRRSS